MTERTKLSHKILSVFLCLTLIMSYLPTFSLMASAADDDSITTIADSSTMNDWQNFFPMGTNINTENAGGIWTDKSVFTNDDAFSDITMTEKDSFLVALSAMGSNMTVTGMSSVPTDTMLVLDVSGSMNGRDDNNNVAKQLAQAANTTIATLLNSNKFNRVGLILYSGDNDNNGSTGNDNAVLVLPLGRYTTTDNEFLTYTYYDIQEHNEKVLYEYISLSSNVVIEGTSSKPSAITKQVVGSTYTQKGIALAMKHFTAISNATTVTDPTLGTVKRKPIMVLMSDGAPTYSTADFTNPGDSQMGTGGSATVANGFVTQLTAAYAKLKIQEKYDNAPLFYTLGLGLSSTSTSTDDLVAKNVLNPLNEYDDRVTTGINSFWKTYIEDTAVNDTVVVQEEYTEGKGKNQVTYPAVEVVKIAETLNRYYVDSFFDTNDYGTNLQTALIEAFKAITDDIQLQSRYFPTLVEGDENLSGYVTFVDKIGKYMEVTSVEGIRLHQTLFSGADLASNFVENGGALGTATNPSDLGNEMVFAVMQRIGTPDIDTARTLIGLAYQYGQLSYDPVTKAFSNYIGWLADADGKFLGFWHENIAESNIPANAVYVMKSYGYLGETDTAHGVEKSDMMYATVQLREEIATGEQTVTFAVPAALIPTVTYEVSLDETGELEKLEATGATAPIRLVYKVALKEGINKFNVNEVVDSEYIANNTNPDGSVNFYTNQYEVDNSTGFDPVSRELKNNTYTYFRPSRQNDRYYYQQTALVYTDSDGTLYRGNTQPSGEMYHGYTVYFKNGNQLEARTVYHRLTAETLGTADRTDNSTNTTWYIPVGDVRRDYAGYVQEKAPSNTTGTLTFAAAPFTDINGHSVDDTNHFFVVGATLGNNGKLTLERETGIKLTKAMANGVNANGESFEFILTNTTNTNDSSSYPAYKVAADGTATTLTIRFVNGVATNVFLAPDEALYIGGMNAGDVINVKEVETDSFTVETLNGNKANSADITVVANSFENADFVNTERGMGNLTIAKEIEHDFATNPSAMAEKEFTITATLTLNGAPLANRQYNNGAIETDANGQFTITLKHGEHYEIFGIPAGTIATVVEENPGTGFTPVYWDSAVLGDGIVEIAANNTVSVIIVNDYEHTKNVKPVNITVNGNKTLTNRAWLATDEFTFQLQKWDSTAEQWVKLGNNAKVDGSTAVGTTNPIAFEFAKAFENEEYAKVGTYYYQIVELEPTNKIGGVSYDKTIHSFSVTVTDDDMDGALEIAEVTTYGNTQMAEPTADSFVITASFENTYSTTGEASVVVDLQKSVINDNQSPLATLNGFEFGLYDGDTLIAKSGKTDARGFARIVMNYTPTDLNGKTQETYNYTLKEIVPNPKPNAWIYDTKEIPVTVVLTSDEGVLSAVVYQDTSSANADSAISTEFVNSYVPNSTDLELDFINKDLNGRDLVDGEFKFKLEGVNNNTSLTGKNTTSGKVSFNDKLYYDTVGTYFYDISEVKGDVGGVTYDETIYRLVVTVTDVNGELQAEYDVVNTDTVGITFVNNYTAAPVTNAISGTKELVGRALLNEEFTFVLTEAVNANGDVEANATQYFAKNTVVAKTTQTGTFTFPEITYNNAGVYYYTVAEQEDTHSATYGVEYSKAKFVVAVEIIDDGSGQLKVESVTYGDADEITFVNKYVAKATSTTLPGEKILEGRVLNDQEFSFTLYESNNDWTFGKELETVKNNADGSFAFSSIEFTEVGTYYYLVAEEQGNKGGVTYDETIYRVRVEITDDLRGQLHASVYVFNSYGIPQGEIVFVNSYEVEGNELVTLEGTKTLNGRDLVDGEFTFELYEADEAFTAGNEPAMTAVNENGKFSFQLEFTEDSVGETFYYVVAEKNAGETIDGVTYSDVQYNVTVSVYDDGLGGIETVTTVTDGEKAIGSLDFTNEFVEETPPEIPDEPEIPEPPVIPNTDAGTNLQMLFALLYTSGAGVFGTMLFSKKKNEQAEE